MIRYKAAPDVSPDVVTMVAHDVGQMNRQLTTWHRLTVHITPAGVYRLPTGELAYCAWARPTREPAVTSSVDVYVAGHALDTYAFCGCDRANALRWLRDALLRELLAYLAWGAPGASVSQRRRVALPSWQAVNDLREQLDSDRRAARLSEQADAERARRKQALRDAGVPEDPDADYVVTRGPDGAEWRRPKYGWEL